jgi:hypothetical protein
LVPDRLDHEVVDGAALWSTSVVGIHHPSLSVVPDDHYYQW